MRPSAFPTRRTVLRGAAVSLGTAILRPGVAAAQATFSNEQLLAEQPLPDLWLGAAGAPVTMIEYASMTCTHCAAFHAETYPILKSKYIDAGKVRFTLREFPLDPLATAGFMLARCGSADKRYPLIDLLFDQQKNWAFVDKPVEALAGLVKQAGITQADFESCLKNQQLYDQVNNERERAAKAFTVDATPTFFINGKKHAGEMNASELDALLAPLVKS